MIKISWKLNGEPLLFSSHSIPVLYIYINITLRIYIDEYYEIK